MAMTRARKTLLVLVVGCLVALPVLLYLRDPPWLLTSSSGFRGWERGPDGERFRWMGGHASFFVDATARSVELPFRTSFAPGDWSIMVTVSIDDRQSDRLVLSDGDWHRAVLRLPPPGDRKARRIDIRLDRVREEDRGAIVGEPRIR